MWILLPPLAESQVIKCLIKNKNKPLNWLLNSCQGNLCVDHYRDAAPVYEWGRVRGYRLRWCLSSQHYTSRWRSSCRLWMGACWRGGWGKVLSSRQQSCRLMRYGLWSGGKSRWNEMTAGSQCDTRVTGQIPVWIHRLTGKSGRGNWTSSFCWPWGSHLTLSQSQWVWAVAKDILQCSRREWFSLGVSRSLRDEIQIHKNQSKLEPETDVAKIKILFIINAETFIKSWLKSSEEA